MFTQRAEGESRFHLANKRDKSRVKAKTDINYYPPRGGMPDHCLPRDRLPLAGRPCSQRYFLQLRHSYVVPNLN